MGRPLSPVAAAVVLTLTLALAPASVAAAQGRARIVLESGEELIGVIDETDETAEDRFDLVLASGERRTIRLRDIRESELEPSHLRYGPWLNFGIALGATWTIVGRASLEDASHVGRPAAPVDDKQIQLNARQRRRC